MAIFAQKLVFWLRVKQETSKAIGDLIDLNHYKDEEIKTLKREISILTDARNQYQQNHSDLTLKHILMEEKLVNLQRKHKTLEDKNCQILQQLTHMKEKINTDQNNHHTLNSTDEEKQSNETTPTGSDEQARTCIPDTNL